MPNTREKLIELLRGAVHLHGEQHDKWVIGGKQGERPSIFNSQADHLIANGVTFQNRDIHWATEQAYKNGCEAGKPKWIPVTERLPEVGVQVLCWYEYFRFGSYNRMYQTYGIGYYFRDGMWGGEVSNGQKAKVLAWMPLPEPPKGE